MKKIILIMVVLLGSSCQLAHAMKRGGGRGRDGRKYIPKLRVKIYDTGVGRTVSGDALTQGMFVEGKSKPLSPREPRSRALSRCSSARLCRETHSRSSKSLEGLRRCKSGFVSVLQKIEVIESAALLTHGVSSRNKERLAAAKKDAGVVLTGFVAEVAALHAAERESARAVVEAEKLLSGMRSMLLKMRVERDSRAETDPGAEQLLDEIGSDLDEVASSIASSRPSSVASPVGDDSDVAE